MMTEQTSLTWIVVMNMKDALRELNDKPVIDIWPTTGVLLGLSRTGAYEAAARGDFEILRLGRLRKVVSASLRKQLKMNPEKAT